MSYKVEYWENEEAREYGLGEIYDSEIKSKTKAIAIADMLYEDGCSAVEVINEQNDKVVYGNYDEDSEEKNYEIIKDLAIEVIADMMNGDREQDPDLELPDIDFETFSTDEKYENDYDSVRTAVEENIEDYIDNLDDYLR